MSERDPLLWIDGEIDRLVGPEPTHHQAPIPEERSYRQVMLMAVAAVALLVVGGFAGWQGHGVATTRGLAEHAAVLDLRMVVERGGQAVRVHEDAAYLVGERVFFRIAASEPTEVGLWVHAPDGVQEIARTMAGPQAQDLGSGESLVAWEFDRPGQYRFVLVQGEPAVCTPARCPGITLEVGP